MGEVPKEVSILPEIREYAQLERPLKFVFKDGYWRIGVRRLMAKLRSILFLCTHRSKESIAGIQYTVSAIAPILPAINPSKEYDLAVSFLTPHNIVRDKVWAKKKIAWIHTDYSYVSVNTQQESPIWMAFDNIVAVSDEVAGAFLTCFPEAGRNIITIENILSPHFVLRRSSERDVHPELRQFFKEEKSLILLTIGRFTYQKNMDSIPSIMKVILMFFSECQVEIKWFIIGYGPDRSLIQEMIRETGMEDKVILLGKKLNPYPYIKACDIYIQPSRYEGKAVTVREAQMLCKPVVITDYATAKSQVDDGNDGVVVPLDIEGCAKGIVSLIKDKQKQERIITYLKEHDYGNESEIEKFYELIP